MYCEHGTMAGWKANRARIEKGLEELAEHWVSMESSLSSNYRENKIQSADQYP